MRWNKDYCMDGWMNGWMDLWFRWMDGWIDGWMDGWTDGQTNGNTNGWGTTKEKVVLIDEQMELWRADDHDLDSPTKLSSWLRNSCLTACPRLSDSSPQFLLLASAGQNTSPMSLSTPCSSPTTPRVQDRERSLLKGKCITSVRAKNV